MSRAAIHAVVLALAMLVPAAPAAAIIGGAPDGNGHPYVGGLDATPVGRPFGPTGVLISPTVLLTAGHVTSGFAARGLTHPRVTFDPVVSTATTWYTGTVHTHPSFGQPPRGESDDLGVVVLDTPVAGITPASLPTAGLLDALGPQGLRDATFTVVGYGISRFLGGSNGGGPPQVDPTSGGTRKVAQETFMSLSPGWLRLLMHEGGQTCAGDSGGPSLFGDSNVVAAITVTGDAMCKNMDAHQRLDTPSARAFLGQYVALP